MEKVTIVSRHPGLVAWLARKGITGEVIPHVTDSNQIRGRHVFGALPLHLAAKAASVTSVDIPGLPAEKRGQDLSPEEMDLFGATMASYTVARVDLPAPEGMVVQTVLSQDEWSVTERYAFPKGFAIWNGQTFPDVLARAKEKGVPLFYEVFGEWEKVN